MEQRKPHLIGVSAFVGISITIALLYLRFYSEHIPTFHLHIPAIIKPFKTPNTATIEVGSSPCSIVTIQQLNQLRQPFANKISIHTFANGVVVHENEVLRAGTAVCFIVAVPQSPSAQYKGTPIKGKGPDAVHFLLSGNATRVTVPPLRPLAQQIGIDREFTTNTILYFAETNLKDPGWYEPYANREWANWEWVNDWWDDTERNVTVFASGLEVPFESAELRVAMQHNPRFHDWDPVLPEDKFPPIIQVITGAEKPRKSLPPCSNEATGDRGRWLAISDYSDVLIHPLVDEWGWGWAADDCKLDYYSDQDIMDCFANKTLHFYGDSNLHRLSKAVLSGGRFCHDIMDVCQTEDGNLPVQVLKGNETGGLEEEWQPAAPRSSNTLWTFPFSYDAQLTFWFTPTITLMFEYWTRALYGPNDILWNWQDRWEPNSLDHLDHVFKPNRDLKLPEAVAHRPIGTDVPDLVVVGIGTWDEAFAPTLDSIAQVLPYFRDALLQAYPDVPIVIRLSNGFCCRHNVEDFRRITGPRVQHFNDLMREAFHIEGSFGMDGQVLVIDPEPLTGRPEVVKDFSEVKSNHARFSQVRIEANMMYNSVCERDSNGKARFREKLMKQRK